jgi:DNA-binding transcriptional MerR regulator
LTIDLMHIGELSRRSGLPVKTIRYYSDVGLVPEAARSRSGYRRYDGASLLRLEFVRTLRELGLDIATIRRVLDRGEDLSQVAAAHAEALGAQIRVLRLRRAALRAVARRSAATRREPTPEEVDRMNRIAQATADERRRIIEEFLDSIFEGIPVDPGFAARMRSATPQLPDDPTDEQVDAWIELAELVRDQSFRDRLRAMSQRSFGSDRPTPAPTGEEAMRTANLVAEKAGAALEAGIDPASPPAQPVVDELVAAFAASTGRTDDAAYRAELLEQIELGTEPRAERYWQLLATINGWPPIPSKIPAWIWFIEGLRAGRSASSG